MAAMHDKITGPNGAAFLLDISKFEWPDGGPPGFEVELGKHEAPPAQEQGELAYAIANFLADKQSDLLAIRRGWFGHDTETVGAANPRLVRWYAHTLIPFQSSLACDPAPAPGFPWYPRDCPAALSRSRSLVDVLNTGTQAAREFADAAYKLADTTITRFADGLLDPSRRFDQGPKIAGGIVGLIASASKTSGIDVLNPQQLVNRAVYLTANTLIPFDQHSQIPPKYLANNALLSPLQINVRFGNDELDSYYSALRTYLDGRKDASAKLAPEIRDAYIAAEGN